jgi:hypothetical protein
MADRAVDVDHGDGRAPPAPAGAVGPCAETMTAARAARSAATDIARQVGRARFIAVLR